MESMQAFIYIFYEKLFSLIFKNINNYSHVYKMFDRN